MQKLLRGIVLAVSATVAALPCGLADEIGLNEIGLNEIGLNEIGLNEIGLNEIGLNEIGLDEQLLSSGASDADSDACEGQAAGCCDDLDADCPSRRFYITGIIGASFGTLQSGGINNEGNFPNTGRATDSLLTAGAAIGMAFDRDNGLLRLEVEGRGRDALQGSTNSFEPPTPTFFYSVRASDGWSVMTNAWRDWYLTERLGFYTGGGIGAGGYRLSVDDSVVSGYGHVGGFAWQAGTGTTYRITNRTTIDLGYRFFDTVSDSLPLTLGGPGGPPAGSYVSNFYASELLLSVRIYEPFRSRIVR